MEPQIQYCKTSDGVNIAYWTMGEGEGTPLLMTPPAQWSHISLELGIPELRTWYELLARDRMIIRYDWRGQGRSDRNIEEFREEVIQLDIAAVVDKLGIEQVNVAGFAGPAWMAVRYAALYPDKVRKLVLWQAVTRPKDMLAAPGGQALRVLLETDWETYTETFAHQALGWRPGPTAHGWAAFIRQSVDQETEKNVMSFLASTDLDRSILESVTADTLILAANDPRNPLYSFMDTYTRDLASGIANSRVVILRHDIGPVWEKREATDAIDAFLRDDDAAHGTPAGQINVSGTATILFADIADSTALTERLGDTAFRDKARDLDEALRRAITSNGGTAIEGKLLGDGVLATFGAAREAIACAAACHAASKNVDLALHVGIHAGDVIREDDNVYGGAVNIAARVSAEAAAGETLVSATVRDLARTSAGVSFDDRGERELKGVGEPVRVFAVR